MTGRELIASVCDDAIRIFELRLDGKSHVELYATEEFGRIRTKVREHQLDLTDDQILEQILIVYSARLKET